MAGYAGTVESEMATSAPALVDSEELRLALLQSRRALSTRRVDTRDLLARAAATIDELDRAILETTRELVQMTRERQAAQLDTSSTDEIIGSMLSSAARVIGTAQDEAQREAAELVEKARAEVERVEQLHHEAETRLAAATERASNVLTEALAEAEEIAAAARNESEALLTAARSRADAVAAAAAPPPPQVAAPETPEPPAVEAATTPPAEEPTTSTAHTVELERWADRIREALARIDALELPATTDASDRAGAPSLERDLHGLVAEAAAEHDTPGRLEG
jgi:hypothetical protein